MPAAVVFNPFQHYPLDVGQSGDSSRVLKSRLDSGFPFELVDAGLVHIAGDGHLGANVRDKDHIARQQPDIVGFIALFDQIVEIELDCGLSIAAQLNTAHASSCGWPPRGEERNWKHAPYSTAPQ